MTVQPFQLGIKNLYWRLYNFSRHDFLQFVCASGGCNNVTKRIAEAQASLISSLHGGVLKIERTRHQFEWSSYLLLQLWIAGVNHLSLKDGSFLLLLVTTCLVRRLIYQVFYVKVVRNEV